MKNLILGLLFMSSCSTSLKHLDYLQQIDSTEIQKFVQAENKLSFERLKTDPLFPIIEKEVLDIITAKDKLPNIFISNNQVYQFWQDQTHIRGVLKRISIEDFNHQKNNWEVVIDIDALAKLEDKNWVWKGFQCYEKNMDLCLIDLSNGGKDAIITREYNFKTKQFVKNGFEFPEGKNNFSWYDENTLLWSDGIDAKKLTDSGYPQTLKVIKRGQTVQQALLIDEVPQNYISIDSYTVFSDKKVYRLIDRQISFYSSEKYLFNDLNSVSEKIKLPIPLDARLYTIYLDQIIFETKSELKTKTHAYPAGSLLSFDVKSAFEAEPKIVPVFIPTETQIFQSLSVSKNKLWLHILNDVKRDLVLIERKNNSWVRKEFDSFHGNNKIGNWSLQTTDKHSDSVYLTYSDFLTPTQLYYANDHLHQMPKLIVKSPERFDAHDFESHQYKI